MKLAQQATGDLRTPMKDLAALILAIAVVSYALGAYAQHRADHAPGHLALVCPMEANR